MIAGNEWEQSLPTISKQQTCNKPFMMSKWFGQRHQHREGNIEEYTKTVTSSS